MRYDLEINIVGELTQAGLSSLAETFYGDDTTISSVIPPAKWDMRTLVATTLINKGAVGTKQYRGGKDIPPAAYTSGIANPSDIELYKYLIRDNIICPLFKGGYVYIHNYKYAWSNNTTVKNFEVDEVHDRYWCDIEAEIDVNSIDIHTLELKFPGYMTYGRRWVYAELISVLDGDGAFDLTESLKETYKAVPEDYKFTVIPTKDDQDRVTKNTIYLNGGIIKYTDLEYGEVEDDSVRIFGVKEFPLKDLTITVLDDAGIPIPSYTDYRYFTSVIRVKNVTGASITAKASWTVQPIVSYAQSNRADNTDVVYKNLNIIPNSISFKDGLICLFNLYGSPGGTILTDDGTNILYPFYLSLTADKEQLAIYDTVRLTAKVFSANSIPVKGAKLTFEVDGDLSKFVESNTDSYVARTGIDGMAQASVIVKPSKFGWYVQKEWINGNEITLPFDINHYDPNEIYVYFITNDDPVLGKVFAEYGDGGDPKGQFSFYDVLNRAETPIEEVYNRAQSLDAYQISGRKIAYVKLQQDKGSNRLYSSFVKPVQVTPGLTKTIGMRNLFIRNTFEPIMADKNMPTTATLLRNASDNSLFVTDIPLSLIGYRPGSVPQRSGLPLDINGNVIDYLSILQAEVTNCTVITFAEDIPLSDRVSGMWLITGSSGYLIAKAVLDDRANDIHIESNAIKIPIVNFIKSEYEFILSDVDLAGQNTAFGAFSYFTVSEYLNNPFGLNACTYACIYSDAIGKKCTNKKIPGDKYYMVDAQNISCIHTPEYDAVRNNWDASKAPEPSAAFKCPGLDARFVNPFVLFQGERAQQKQGWFDITSPEYWVPRLDGPMPICKWTGSSWVDITTARMVWLDALDFDYIQNMGATKLRVTIDGGGAGVLFYAAGMDFAGSPSASYAYPYTSASTIDIDFSNDKVFEGIGIWADDNAVPEPEPFYITKIEIYIP